MKEKLIELLKAAYDYGNELCSGREICLGCLYADDPYGCEYGAPADHLLANGVIVLPCKVGDTVWRVRPELCVYREKDACANYCEGFDTFCEEYEGGKWIERSRFCLSMLDDFGKTVFLTREEAEAALKGTVSTMETVEPREEPVLCVDCEYLEVSGCYGECGKAYKGIVQPNDSCGKGVRAKPKEEGT